MAINPAIVISAYNRPGSLQRLLASVAAAFYESNTIDLIISIDKSYSTAVIEIAEQFVWVHGQKKIITHSEKLGLKKHILNCGDLALEYGYIILLEDDLLVSPYFYSYAQQAQNFYENDASIAGISLYNYQVAESCFYPFTAIDDGSDVYFMQVASSWGQLWTAGQWQAFKSWLNKNTGLPTHEKIPTYLNAWGEHSWKKHFIHYLIDADKYFVFPRVSLSTNFEDVGTNASTKNSFQVPLQVAHKEYRFAPLEKSRAVYDAWFEMQPACLNTFNENLKPYNYAIDLYGTKPLHALECTYVLTSQKANQPLFTFGNDLFPTELNVAMNLSGEDIGLYKLRGSTFEPAKLKTTSVIEKQKKDDQLGISIVIPIEKIEVEKLAATLASIASREFENKECILVCHEPNAELEQLIANYNYSIRIIQPEKQLTLEMLAAVGFKKANKGILTWIAPGNTFTSHALSNVASVFRENASVSWIRGVNENLNNYANLNVRSYRLNAGEAYKRLQKENLTISIEQNFLRKHCLEKVNDPTQAVDIFFNLVHSYPLIIVVTKLGSQPFTRPVISEKQKKLLGSHLQPWQKNNRALLFIDFFLTAFFASKKISQWFYPAAANFPDVLRYDAVHNTFYFSKY